MNEHDKKEINDKVKNVILGSFTFVAALAWNEAIQSGFKRFYSPKNQTSAKFIYAIFITIIIILIMIFLK